jgi:hypothetical protein
MRSVLGGRSRRRPKFGGIVIAHGYTGAFPMIHLIGSRVWLAPKNAKPAQPSAQPDTLSEQVAWPRPKHYKQETFLNTLFEFSIGLCVLIGIMYGVVHAVQWLARYL